MKNLKQLLKRYRFQDVRSGNLYEFKIPLIRSKNIYNKITEFALL